MSLPKFEALVGPVDGVNQIFTVSKAYAPGTIAVFFNGLLQERLLLDGFEEDDAAAGVIRMKEPPEPSSFGDDILQAFFMTNERPIPGTVMCRVTAVLKCPIRYRAIVRVCSS